MKPTIFLFGEAEKGEFCTPLFCRSIAQLADTLGNPPEESQGIAYAIQALLFKKELIFYRVKEEGFSTGDYMKGLRLLQKTDLLPHLHAICIPGVGDGEIIDAVSEICYEHRSLLVLSEKDLYDYLTHLH